MADGLNRVILLGNLGSDPELKVTQQGTAVLKLSLATSESWKDDRGQKQERTEWHRVTLWGRVAEALAPHLGKGDRILVEGSIRTSTYEKNGEKRYSTEINATHVRFAGSKRDGGGESKREAPPGQQQQRKAPPWSPPRAEDDDVVFSGGGDDDIPF